MDRLWVNNVAFWIILCIIALCLNGCSGTPILPDVMVNAALGPAQTRTSCTGNTCFTMDQKGNVLNETTVYPNAWRR